MTHFEFWINLAIVILLIPTILLCIRLCRQLGKLNQNQEKMMELAAALRRAAETYGTTADSRRQDAAPSPVLSTASFDLTAEETSTTTEKEPHFERLEHGNEAPSEAERELLQALHSIK